MTIGEIKIEALKLMFTNYEQDITVDDIEDLKLDETFGSYLVNMNESINRAINRYVLKGVVPHKTATLDEEDGTIGTLFTRYSLATLITDYYKVVSVAKESEYGYYDNLGYIKEGQTVALPTLLTGETYIIEYVPKLERIIATTAETTVLSLPDLMAEYIPYYIKAELYEEDEPEIAAVARNIFEQFIAELQQEQFTGYQTVVERIYHQ